ncbi:DUF58 domain-containing protein [Thermobrachium celere]|uniref:DUF58 domain-containing protein n=1 Tax=Thermobrachium celere TaxID=53422 RepID=UPI0019447BC7|nr:DUF58 domain-containing protein [Thermobrachium celere]GFR35476.1 hypothetical protein TCEA9_12880 [Thermobrachium celere]
MFKIKKSSFVLLLVSMLFVASVGSELFYKIFYLIFFSMLFSIIWCKASCRFLFANQNVDKVICTTKDEVNINTEIVNSSVLPIPYVEVDNILSAKGDFKKEYFSLMPLEKVALNDKIKFNYRGIYNLGPIEVVLWDVFGIICFKKTIKIDKSIFVYPKLHHIEKITLPNVKPLGIHRSRISTDEDYTSIRNIRNYIVGDNLKRVHWKLTAKRGEMQVKEYDASASSSVNIILDMTNVYKNLDLEEAAAEVCISIVEYLLRNKVETNLIIVSKRLHYVDGKNINDFYKFNNTITGVKAEGSIDLIDAVKDKLRINKQSSVLFITGELSKYKYDRLIEIKKYLSNLFVISCSETQEEMEGVLYIKDASQIKGGIYFEK